MLSGRDHIFHSSTESFGRTEDWAGSGAKGGPTHPPMADKNVCPTGDFSRA